MAILYTVSRQNCEVGDTNVDLSVLNNITETSKYSRYIAHVYTYEDLINSQCTCAEGLRYLICIQSWFLSVTKVVATAFIFMLNVRYVQVLFGVKKLIHVRKSAHYR